jgi:hypothetical protein
VNGRPRNTTNHPADPDECASIRPLLEGFALDALDSLERSMVEHHLRWCEACRAEAAACERVASLLPLTTTIDEVPGPGVKLALLDRIATGDLEPRIANSPAVGVTAPANVAPGPPPASNPRWVTYISSALIAPLVLALLVMGVWANSMRTDLNARNDVAGTEIALNQALPTGDQVQLYSVEKSCPTCNGSGQLGVSASNEMGMVVGWNFDPGEQHDVWQVNRSGERAKVCQLHVGSTGAVMQMFSLPESPSEFPEVYITNERGELTYISHLGDAITPAETPAVAS